MVILLLFIILIAVLIFRTLLIRRGEAIPMESRYTPKAASKESVDRLSKIIRLKTVTYNDFSAIDMEEHRKIEVFFKKLSSCFLQA